MKNRAKENRKHLPPELYEDMSGLQGDAYFNKKKVSLALGQS